MIDSTDLVLIGLTGGIASGKSLVSNMLWSMGAQIIDADDLARRAVLPGTAGHAQVKTRWPQCFQGNALDRRALGEIVFRNKAQREELESSLIPGMLELFRADVGRIKKAGFTRAIYDAALIVEKEMQNQLDGLIVVGIDPQIQRHRLMLRNRFTAEQAEARIATQARLDTQLQYATWVVWNNGTKEETRQQVEKIWPEILERGKKAR